MLLVLSLNLSENINFCKLPTALPISISTLLTGITGALIFLSSVISMLPIASLLIFIGYIPGTR